MAAPAPADQPQGSSDGCSLPERNFVADALRTETVGGVLLLVAAVAALIWANTPLSGSYETVSDFHFGPAALGLDLSVAALGRRRTARRLLLRRRHRAQARTGRR